MAEENNRRRRATASPVYGEPAERRGRSTLHYLDPYTLIPRPPHPKPEGYVTPPRPNITFDEEELENTSFEEFIDETLHRLYRVNWNNHYASVYYADAGRNEFIRREEEEERN